jgi:hypothetical protein
MELNYKATECTSEMREEGINISSSLFDLTVDKALGDTAPDLSEYPERWRDLFKDYLEGNKVSVEIIYIAMERRRNETSLQGYKVYT